MGKDSLIKSTTKKTAAKKTTKKKTASKTSSKTTAKAKAATAKNTRTAKAAPKKAKAAPKPKPKKITKPKTKAAAKPKAKKATKRVTVKELLLKSFDPITKIAKPEPAASRKKASPSAPPFVDASDPKETARIRKLLFQSYDMAEIKAAGAAPPAAASEAAPPPVIKPEQEAPAPKSPPSQAHPTPAAEAPTVITDLPTESASDPISKPGKLLIAAACVLILLILMVSYSNSSKYYIKAKDNSIEIWKGRFSPKDNTFFMVLHGTQFLGNPKAVYTRAEVYPIISNYYLDKANTLLEVPGLPDFEGIKSYLHNAKNFAITKEMRKLVAVRINNIERMTLIFKADAGITKGTKKSLDAAIEQLTSAQALITNPAQEQEIQQKLSLANNLKQVLKNKESKKGK